MSCKELIESLDSCITAKDFLVSRHWYEFYNNAYTELVTSHAALFGGLIAIAIALFGLKYWLENQNIDNKIKEKINEKADSIQSEYNLKLGQLTETIEELQKSAIIFTRPYKFYLKTLFVKEPTKKNCAEILDTIKDMLNSSYNDDVKRMIYAELSGWLKDIKKVVNRDLLDENSRKIVIDITKIFEKMKESKNTPTEFVLLNGEIISYFNDLAKKNSNPE